MQDLPSPRPAPGQVRVRVTAAAVNYPDVLLIANRYQISVPPPFVPGSEFAGVVTALGDAPDDLAPTSGPGTVGNPDAASDFGRVSSLGTASNTRSADNPDTAGNSGAASHLGTAGDLGAVTGLGRANSFGTAGDLGAAHDPGSAGELDTACNLAIGDRVTGTVLHGAFAEEVVVATGSVARIPDGIDDRTAAAFGVAHRTAYHALRSVARVGSGDHVIVLGAGGGVGLAAVQLAALLGAEVTAVASSAAKLEAAASCGARNLVDHKASGAEHDHARALREALRATVPEGADAVVDPVGGDLSEPALRSLRRGGRFVTVGYASGTIPRIPLNLVLVKGIQILGFQFGDIGPEEFRRHDEELTALLATGRIRPHIGATYPLGETASALRQVADGRAIGKILIDPR
ncbi:zinc-binding dehydrogenase [Nocardia sp. BMG51109]|uniref:zinc-binding dehydrogenase n=1 Tax=Nocardia sp. BMG51109 TaxID=1056816 RepID=UPI0004B60511